MDVVKVGFYADQLREYANHFVTRDWNYTRDTRHIREIRLNDPYEALHRRVWRAVRSVIFRDSLTKTLESPRFGMVTHYLKRDKNLPDGVLDSGNIITFWEETGEYLQYVQPSVGSLFAEWMLAEPENPHAQKIAAEMKRINDSYAERLRNNNA